MAGVIHKDDPRHPKHPEYGKVAREREKLLAVQAAEKKAADEKAAVDKKLAEKKAADEKAKA